MVIIANEENGESAEWIDEEELDLNGISISPDEETNTFPIFFHEGAFFITMGECMTNIHFVLLFFYKL